VDTKKPATLKGCGLCAMSEADLQLEEFRNQLKLLQPHSLFVRRRLLLGKAVNIAAPQ
jgi:hypothetical protein